MNHASKAQLGEPDVIGMVRQSVLYLLSKAGKHSSLVVCLFFFCLFFKTGLNKREKLGFWVNLLKGISVNRIALLP